MEEGGGGGRRGEKGDGGREGRLGGRVDERKITEENIKTVKAKRNERERVVKKGLAVY